MLSDELLSRHPDLRCDDRLAPRNTWVYPCMAVLPMGFSWAMNFSQQVHDAALSMLPGVFGPGVKGSQFFAPGLLAPEVGNGRPPAILAYADNGNFFGCNPTEVQAIKDKAATLLQARSLPVHEELDAALVASVLGVKIEGSAGVVRPTDTRVWRVIRAIEYIERRPQLSGAELEVLVGDLTFMMMIERKLLSLLSSCYVYIKKCYGVRQTIWPSVLRELCQVRRLLPRCQADLRAPWDTTVCAVDASGSGFGIVETEWPREHVRACGVWNDRWRFRFFAGSVPAREQALEAGEPPGLEGGLGTFGVCHRGRRVVRSCNCDRTYQFR